MPYISSIEQIGRQEGQQNAYREVIKNLLMNRFADQDGILDEALLQVIEPLAQLPVSEFTALLLTRSRNEILQQFGSR